MEEDDEYAKQIDRERVKEATDNADAKVHQHDELEGAERPVRKRDCVVTKKTSGEGEPPNKVIKCSLLSLETGPGPDLVDRGAATAAGLGQPVQCDAETLQDQGAEVNDRGENMCADERVANRCRILSNHPSAEDAPPKKVNAGEKHTTTATPVCTPGEKEAAQEARRRQQGHGRSNAYLSATVAMGATDHGCPPSFHAGDNEDASATMEVYGRRGNRRPWMLEGRLVCGDGHRPRSTAGHRPYGNTSNFSQGCGCEAR